MPFEESSASVPFQSVKILDLFWNGRFDAVKNGALPAMYDQMKQTGRWDSLKLQWKAGDPNPP